MAYSVQVTFDAHDPQGLARFWIEALGYVVPPPPGDFGSWDEALDAWGVPADERDRAFALVDPDGAGPRLFFQKVPEPKTAKNRVHLDVNVGARAGGDADAARAAVRAHATRLEALGAERVREVGPDETTGEFWIVMRDPEGNELCVQ
ncbi:VOC family protein [Luteimicrobium sp. DT211]|uniref:VOC family protein n=1 Tax=Luteimicrobium sp. DT211 TaxID=3393412 RepID=UPI003CE95EB1